MMDLKRIIAAKRMKREEKQYLCKKIIDQAMYWVRKKGEFEIIQNLDTKVKNANVGNLKIGLYTPFNKVTNEYILDILLSGQGKVFSAHWTNPNEFEIINLKKGDWIETLLT